MNPHVSSPTRPSTGLTLRKPISVAPFPYVILGGREESVSGQQDSKASKSAGNERDLFVAHVELNAPRWNNAREALVRSLATDSAPPVQAFSEDDAAWDRVETAPPMPPVGEPPVMKLKSKRRLPTLEQRPEEKSVAAVPRAPLVATPVAAMAAHDDLDLPVLQDGLAPLAPIPGSGPMAPSRVRTPAAPIMARTAPVAVEQSGGWFKRAVGIVMFGAMLCLAAYLLFSEFVMPGAQAAAPAQRGGAQASPAAVAPSPRATAAPVSETTTAAAAPVAKATTPAGATGTARASAAFENYVAGLRVSGVSLGASPRALINGRLVQVGDLIDPTLGVRLVSVDGASRHLVFEDINSAKVTARY